jgi:transposase
MNPTMISLEQHLAEKEEWSREIASLKEQLEWFKRQLFGKKSEKTVDRTDVQPTLFDLSAFDTPSEVKLQKIEPFTRRIKSSIQVPISFPDDLPVERKIYDLQEKEKTCPLTNKPLVKIGEDITQKLAFKPGSYFIKEIVRPKYALPKGAEESILMANLPDSIIPRCKADESLLADILVKKFSDHLPLYRQSEMLARDNIFVSRQTLSNWVVKCGQALKPLYNEILKSILENRNVFIDEVPVDMLDPGKGKTHKAYMWVMVGGKAADPYLRAYNFRTNRGYKNAAELLTDFEDGIVHSDKYGAYETLANRKKFIWCPCWAHIRRNFIEAEGGDHSLIQFVLRKIRYLFMLEKVAWSRSEDERLRIRQEKEIPIIDELIHTIKNRFLHGKTIPKSKYKEALGYFIGLIPYLKNYTKHAFARLDNNVAERAVRPLALGRKNWLFLGSEEGGEAAAIILSLVQTCKALKINPREYLADVMNRLMSHPFQKINQLLPHNWSKN